MCILDILYVVLCVISHMCVHVLNIVAMWLEERFSSVHQDFHIVDDCPKQSLQE